MSASGTTCLTPGILEGEAEMDRLRDALAIAQGDLRLHVLALSRLQGELVASRLEVSGTRGETVHYQGYLRHSQANVESAHAHIAELEARAAGREAEFQATLVALRTEASALRAEVAMLRASSSWRLTRPVRAVGNALRWCKRVLRPGSSTAPARPGDGVVVPPFISPDPNAPYLFRPAPFQVTGQGTVTVDELYRLSRSP